MEKIAKTFFNTNGFTSPQGLSTFGIKINQDKNLQYLGLEEFNFSKEYLDNKIAYIPAFASETYNYKIDKLDLFYLNTELSPHQTFHYATLYEVNRISGLDYINDIRSKLLQSNLIWEAFYNKEFRNAYGNNFNEAFKSWVDRLLYFNNIDALGDEQGRFVVNIRYESIEIFANPLKTEWGNMYRANKLYHPVNIQGIFDDLNSLDI